MKYDHVFAFKGFETIFKKTLDENWT